ncbi:uncharacterized protein J4E92_007381 [Alternaria infectoria]|uniref:uncharacterized protein n=1 Tax=Alternaria infectoria TaxID=45303 RepID=UPI002220CF3F|nr:uncharacterized protein J4E92_007381 [Alternaria infectoria]KAI4924300.1 hypothetical protein J4E92_007381 [Alternaria infectoria]
MELEPQSQPSVISITTWKRKRCADEQTNPALTSPAKKLKTSVKCTQITTEKPTTTSRNTPGSKSTLIPRGPRKKATIGVKDESLLLMLCDSNTTPRKTTELHFRKIPHSHIDWHNPHHISQINAWRNQIYGRAGLKARSVSLWYEAEELWFELYFQLSIVEARKRGIMLPGNVEMEAVVKEEEVREMEAKELDAVAALVSLANSPVDSRCD